MANAAQELKAELANRTRELEAVRRISEALYSKTNLDDLERETLRVSMEVVDANAGSIILYDPEQEKLVFKYVVGDKTDVLTGMTMEPDQGICGEVLQSGEAKISEDVSKDEAHYRKMDERTKYVTKNMVTVPLRSVEGETIGVMQILNKQGDIFDEQDLAVLSILGTQAATAWENARLFEEARLAIVVKMMGDISHDVKNLITPVMTCAQTLEMVLQEMFQDLDRIAKEQPADAMEKTKEAVQFLRDFYPEAIEMFEDGSIATQERVREIADCVKGIVAEPQFEMCCVNEVINKIVKPLQMVADRAKVEINTEGLTDVPQTMIDQKQMYNAIYNLVNNAIPEVPAGGKVFLRTSTITEGDFPQGSYVQIEVADTGKGMPEEVRAKLFTKDAISTKPGGTGLGTRIVRNVVEAHQGEITVESELGKGSTFRIKIPLRTEAPQPEA